LKKKAEAVRYKLQEGKLECGGIKRGLPEGTYETETPHSRRGETLTKERCGRSFALQSPPWFTELGRKFRFRLEAGREKRCGKKILGGRVAYGAGEEGWRGESTQVTTKYKHSLKTRRWRTVFGDPR